MSVRPFFPVTVLMTGIALFFAVPASAQDSQTWSDIDCARSKIVAPAGMKCRTTGEANGSSSGRFSGGGVFQSWSAFGTKDGARLYYLIYEGIGGRSYKQVYLSLEEEIKNLSPQAKNGKNFTPPQPSSGGDYLTFSAAKGEPCVAIRKVGPVVGNGYRWVLFATKCVPAGKSISTDDVSQFMSAADYRS